MKFGSWKFLILILIFLVLVITLPILISSSYMKVQGGCDGYVGGTPCFHSLEGCSGPGFFCKNSVFNITYNSISFSFSQNFSNHIYNVHLDCLGGGLNASVLNTTTWYALTSSGVLESASYDGASVPINSSINIANLHCSIVKSIFAQSTGSSSNCFFGDIFARFTLNNGPPSPSNPWITKEAAHIGACLNSVEKGTEGARIGTLLSLLVLFLWFVMAMVLEFSSYIKEKNSQVQVTSSGITAFSAISLTIISFMLLTGIYDTIASPPGVLFDNTSLWVTIIEQITSIILVITSIFLCVKNRWIIQDEKASKIIFWVPISLSILSFFAILPFLNSINLFTGLPFINLVGSVCLPYELIPAILVYSFILYLPVAGSLMLGLSIHKNNRKFTLLILESLVPLFLAFIGSFMGPVSWSLNYLSYIGFASLPMLLFMIYFAFNAPKILDDNKSRRKLSMLFAVAFSLFVMLLVFSMPLGICF